MRAHAAIRLLLCLSLAMVGFPAAAGAAPAAKSAPKPRRTPQLLSVWKKKGEEPKPVPARLVQVRSGLGNTFGKLERGEEVRIAYFGGSITEAKKGWRDLTFRWFESEFPDAKLVQINAGVGSTGSTLGVFRADHDLVAHEPDLVFIEFAVNDVDAPRERIWAALEGIVRKLWRADPTTDVCFIYAFQEGFEIDLDAHRNPRAASRHEMFAMHHNLPSINPALRVAQLAQAGRVQFRPRPNQPGLAFSRDGTHPNAFGHQLYAQVINRAMESLRKGRPLDRSDQLDRPFVRTDTDRARLIPISEEWLTGSWNKAEEGSPLHPFTRLSGAVWESGGNDARLTFEFQGTMLKLYILKGQNSATLTRRVDAHQGRRRSLFKDRTPFPAAVHLMGGAGADQFHHFDLGVKVPPERPNATLKILGLMAIGEVRAAKPRRERD